jgi:hypothetical protein
MVDKYCVSCHNERVKTANLMLDRADLSNPGANVEVWEKVMRKVHIGTMPPPNMPQPPQEDRRALLAWLETSLDAAAAAKPNPGRTETLRRLNRTEYRNAVRDLLALDIDANSLLPADESGHGFDNVTVGDLPPTLLDRYISAAQKVSRLAIGSTQTSMQADTIRLPADRTQETHVAGLPLGDRLVARPPEGRGREEERGGGEGRSEDSANAEAEDALLGRAGAARRVHARGGGEGQAEKSANAEPRPTMGRKRSAPAIDSGTGANVAPLAAPEFQNSWAGWAYCWLF